ncbi:MAG: helix-turn-helix domain-containing protein [Clostridiales Family XIII bacterium]|jgi:sugar diacid utilization regulator|nr:helix-turn-helix domain-containing protein [Clostridiales Family XIII bacterium]
MRVSPEMLKDYLSKEIADVTVFGNSKQRFQEVLLPIPGEPCRDDYLYLMPAPPNPEEKVNAIVPIAVGSIAANSKVCLISAPFPMDKLTNLLRECFRFYSDRFEGLYAAIALGENMETILEKSFPLLANPIFIDDSSYRTLARLRDYPNQDFRDNEYIFMQESGHHSADYIYAMLNSNVAVESSAISPRPIIHRFEFLAHRTLYSTIKVGGEIVGFFSCIEIQSQFTAGMMDVFELLTEMLSVALSRQANMPASRQKSLDNDLFLGILNGSIGDPELTKTAFAQVGLAQGDYFVVYTVTDVDTAQNAFLLPRIMELLMSNMESSFAVADGSNIILVINSKLDEDLREKLVRLINFYLGEFNITIGISLGFDDPQQLPLYYDQALAATRLGPFANRDAKVFGYDDVVSYDVLESFGDTEKRLTICHPAVFRLLEHDREKKVNLLPTLKIFVECLGDTSLAAEKLYLHRNSLYYRLRQITALTGIDLTDERVLSHITLSLRILEINGDLTL